MRLKSQSLEEICLSMELQTFSVTMHKKKPLNDDF
jgi:hypothetical protein